MSISSVTTQKDRAVLPAGEYMSPPAWVSSPVLSKGRECGTFSGIDLRPDGLRCRLEKW